jgi:hypothetical protein
MIKRFKQMQSGYFRLLVGSYILLAIAWVILIATEGGVNSAQILPVLTVTGLATLAYWVLVRFYLWIYDGFQHDKAVNQQSLDVKSKKKDGAEVMGDKKS